MTRMATPVTAPEISEEQRFQLLVGAVSDYAIYLLDPQGHIATWNPGGERLKGFTADDVIGRHFSMFFTEPDRAAGKPWRALDVAARTGRVEDEGWRLRKDGSRFWALAVLEAVRDERGRLIGFAKVTRDMTERRAAQEALRQSERNFRLLVNGVTDYAIFLLDLGGRVTNWNSGAARIKGYTAAEIVGEHFSRFYTEEDRRAGAPERTLRIAREEGRFEGEGWRQRKDGSRFWANVVVDAVRDETGTLVGFAKVTRDMTERREAQHKLDETREQLFQAQKMEAIGKLTGGVAHDFNNLLTVILGGVDLAEGLVGDSPKLKRLMFNMRQAAKRGEALTKQLLAFSRRQPLRPEPLDLARQMQTMCDLLARSLRGDIGIVPDFAADLRPIEVDPAQLELAFLNVGLNARDAMPDGGKLHVTASNVDFDGALNILEGEFVAIAVRDTGTGMSEEVRARALEPFFTTKEIGRGSGMGLSQAFGFARQSGGTLTVESAVGEGTTVTFYLPAMPSPTVRDAKATGREHPAVPASAHVLLVEDETSVAELAVGLLEGAGFTVTVAENAKEALDVLAGGAHIDLLFSDIMMPGRMNGAELARAVHHDYPHVFILLATGYADAPTNQLAQEFPLITKPYGRATLLDKLARILGEGH